MARKSTWGEKLARDNGCPQVLPVPASMQKTCGDGTMVIPAPREVDAIMKGVPKGKLITIQEIRARLAQAHGATVACPMTTGIFAWIAAHAAEEAAAAGAKRITPYWRTLKTGGEVNPKYPGGLKAQRALLAGEGHQVVAKGKRYFVADYQKRVVK